MKKSILLLAAIIAFGLSGYSQYEVVENTANEEAQAYKFTLGIGSGINNNCGMLGLIAEANIVQGLSLTGTVGVGGWGVKSSIGLRYYNNFPRKLYYGISFTSAKGVDALELELQTTTSGQDFEMVELDFNRVNNLAFTMGYQWPFFSRARFNIEFGYSLLLTSNNYELVTPGLALSETSETVMNLLTPGGLIFGLGFTFAL